MDNLPVRDSLALAVELYKQMETDVLAATRGLIADVTAESAGDVSRETPVVVFGERRYIRRSRKPSGVPPHSRGANYCNRQSEGRRR